MCHCPEILQFIHSPSGEHGALFQGLSVRNKAAVTSIFSLCVDMFSSPWVNTSKATAASLGGRILYFFFGRHRELPFKLDEPFLNLTNNE